MTAADLESRIRALRVISVEEMDECTEAFVDPCDVCLPCGHSQRTHERFGPIVCMGEECPAMGHSHCFGFDQG
jgi:hypothetical protein